MWHSRSENRTHKGITPPGTEASQHRIWHKTPTDNTHNKVAYSEPETSQNKVVPCDLENKILKEVVCPGSGALQHRQGRSGSEDRTHQGGACPGPRSSQYGLGQSVCEASVHKSGANPGAGMSHRRLRQSGSDDATFQENEEMPDTHERRVTVAVVMKQLAQLYGGHVDTKKAAELVQICTPEFLQQLEAFISSAAPDTAFLSDFATFCLSAFKSLPSSVCIQFHKTLIMSLRLVEKSGDAALKDRFTRLQEKLTEHVRRRQELDSRVAKQNFRSIPVLPVQADAFLSCLDGMVVTGTSMEQRYLKALFLSLYEAFIGHIRDGIRSFRDAESASIQLTSNMHFYRGVRFMNPVLVGDRLCLATNFAPVNHLTTGTLVCFSCNGFRSLVFATVTRTDSQLVVCVYDYPVDRQLFEHEYVMADTGLRAEPSVSVLLTLQQLQVVPMRQYLVEGTTVLERKHHMQEQPDLDLWQREAFSSALADELCVVLGPPGSGKTHIGCTVARDSRPPVFVLCESHSGLDLFLRKLAPLSVMRLSDRTKHEQNQQRRELSVRKNVVLMQLRKLELDLALLACNDGVVSLSSFREGGVVSDTHFKSFMHRPDTASVFYSWLIDGASPDVVPVTRDLVPFCGISPHTEDTLLSTVQSTLKWAERLENVEKKRSEVNTSIGKLQERWGLGQDVTQEIHVQKGLYRLLAFKLKQLRTRLTGTWPSDKLKTCRNVWQLRPVERWGLYFAWVAALRTRLLDKVAHLQAQLVLEKRNLEQVDQLIDAEIAQQMMVVGATAEEATRLRSVLEELAPKTGMWQRFQHY